MSVKNDVGDESVYEGLRKKVLFIQFRTLSVPSYLCFSVYEIYRN